MLSTWLELVSLHPKMHQRCLEKNWIIIGTLKIKSEWSSIFPGFIVKLEAKKV